MCSSNLCKKFGLMVFLPSKVISRRLYNVFKKICTVEKFCKVRSLSNTSNLLVSLNNIIWVLINCWKTLIITLKVYQRRDEIKTKLRQSKTWKKYCSIIYRLNCLGSTKTSIAVECHQQKYDNLIIGKRLQDCI